MSHGLRVGERLLPTTREGGAGASCCPANEETQGFLCIEFAARTERGQTADGQDLGGFKPALQTHIGRGSDSGRPLTRAHTHGHAYDATQALERRQHVTARHPSSTAASQSPNHSQSNASSTLRCHERPFFVRDVRSRRASCSSNATVAARSPRRTSVCVRQGRSALTITAKEQATDASQETWRQGTATGLRTAALTTRRSAHLIAAPEYRPRTELTQRGHMDHVGRRRGAEERVRQWMTERCTSGRAAAEHVC